MTAIGTCQHPMCIEETSNYINTPSIKGWVCAQHYKYYEVLEPKEFKRARTTNKRSKGFGKNYFRRKDSVIPS